MSATSLNPRRVSICVRRQVTANDADAAGILLGLAGAGIAVDDDNAPTPPVALSIDADGKPCRCSAKMRDAAGAVSDNYVLCNLSYAQGNGSPAVDHLVASAL